MFLYDRFGPFGESWQRERTEQLFKFRGRNATRVVFIKLGGKNARFISQRFYCGSILPWLVVDCASHVFVPFLIQRSAGCLIAMLRHLLQELELESYRKMS